MPFLGPAEAQRLASEVYVGWSEERITRLEQSGRVLFCLPFTGNLVPHDVGLIQSTPV